MSSIPDHANVIEVLDDDCEVIYLGERQNPVVANPPSRRTLCKAATAGLGSIRSDTAAMAVRNSANAPAQQQLNRPVIKFVLPLPATPTLPQRKTPAQRKNAKKILAKRRRKQQGVRKNRWNVWVKRNTERAADEAPEENEAQGNHHHLPGADVILGRPLAMGVLMRKTPHDQGDLGVPSLDPLPPLPVIPDPALANQAFRHDTLYGPLGGKNRMAQLTLPRHDRSDDSLEFDGDGAIRMICIVWMRDRCHMLDAHTKTVSGECLSPS